MISDRKNTKFQSKEILQIFCPRLSGNFNFYFNLKGMLSKSRFLSHIFGYRQYSSAQLSRSELDIRLRNLNLKEVQVIGDGRRYKRHEFIHYL